MLPADTASEGFDNVAEALRVTPTHIDQYLAAARDISIQAVGERAAGSRARRLSRAAAATTRSTSTACRSARATACSWSTSSRPTASTSSISRCRRFRARELRGYPYGWLEYRTRACLDDRRREACSARDIGGDGGSRGRSIRGRSRPSKRSRIASATMRVPVKAGRPQRRRDVRRAQLRRRRLLAAVARAGRRRARRARDARHGDHRPVRADRHREPTESRARIFSCYPKDGRRGAAVRASRS